VLAETVVRRFAIEARQRAGENRQLLAGIVADHANLASDLSAFRIELELGRLDEAQLRRIVAIEAEVMDRVAVHGIELDLFPIQEYRLRGHGPRRDDVPIRQDQAALRVDDESGRLARHVPFGVERARQIHLNRDDTACDPLNRARPPRILDFRDRNDRRGYLVGRNRREGEEDDRGEEESMHKEASQAFGRTVARSPRKTGSSPHGNNNRAHTVTMRTSATRTAADPTSFARPDST